MGGTDSITTAGWWAYVVNTAGDVSQSTIAREIGASVSTVNRWVDRMPKPESVVAFAKAYNKPVLEAFIAAGFITAEDARVQVVGGTNPRTLSDEQLIKEVTRRMNGGERDGNPGEKMRAAGDGGTADAGSPAITIGREAQEM